MCNTMTCASCNAARSNGRPLPYLNAAGEGKSWVQKAKGWVAKGTEVANTVNDYVNPAQYEAREEKKTQQATLPWIIAAVVVLVIGIVAVWAINRNQ